MDNCNLGYFNSHKLLLHQFFPFSIYLVRTDFDTFNRNNNPTCQINQREKELNEITYRKTSDFHIIIYPNII